MTKLTWGSPGTRIYDTGIDRGVVYPLSGDPVVWSGLVSVTEEPSSNTPTDLYFDGQKSGEYQTYSDFAAGVEAVGPPSGFERFIGRKTLYPGLSVGYQKKALFNLTYRTLIANDLVGADYGYILHLVYNCSATPTQKKYLTQSSSTSLELQNYTLSATPPTPAGAYRPVAHLAINSLETDPSVLETIEATLYGTSEKDSPPRFLTQSEILALFA